MTRIRSIALRALMGAGALMLLALAVGTLAGENAEVAGRAGPASRAQGLTSSDAGSAQHDAAPKSTAREVVAGGTGMSSAADQPGRSAAVLPDRIVKTADLGLEVDEGRFDAAWNRAFHLATRFSGFVLSSARGQGDPVPLADGAGDRPASGDIVIRVPAARFEEAVVELRKLGRVTSDTTSSQDVGEEFVDLESRLRHLRAQETVLLRLMRRARSIEDTIVVQQQLAQVQQQVEQAAGRLRFLAAQTEFGTIALHLAEPGAATSRSDGPSFAKAWETAVEGLQRIAQGAMIAAIWLAPFALLGIPAVLLWRRRPRQPAAPAEA